MGEEGNMAKEILSSVFAASGVDQEQALTVETCDGIVDCGATKPVMGEITWHKCLQTMRHLDTQVRQRRVSDFEVRGDIPS